MRRSRSIVVSALVLAALGVGCRGDGPTQPTPSLRIAGDSLVAVASTISLTAEGTDSTGAAVTWVIGWQSSDPSVASVNNAGVVSGIAAGTAVITVHREFATATHSVTVRDDRPTVPLAVGSSFTGRIVNGVAAQRLALPVTAGDTLDLLVRMDSANANLFGSHLRSTDAPWLKESVRTSNGITLYGAVVPASTGSTTLEAVGDMVCGGRTCVPPSGAYTVRVRRSAPIFNVARYFEGGFVDLPEGALGRDVVWAQNVGLGSVTVRVTSPVPWLRPDAGTVALAGPKVGGSSPDVATAIGATVDARGLAQGVYVDSLDLDGSTGEWSPFRPFGHHRRRVHLRVTDSSARRVPTPIHLTMLAAAPDGRLYGARNDSIVTVDLATGATTLVIRLPFQPTQLAVGGDGALYARSQSIGAGGVYRIVGTTVEPVLDLKNCEGAFTVLPNGTVYGLCGALLYRRVAGGTPEQVASFAASAYRPSIVYRPADDAVYIVYAGQLWRYDQPTKALSVRSPILSDIGTFALYAVDPQGRLVGTVPYVVQEVRMMDTNGAVLDRRVLPALPFRLAITGSTIVVSTEADLWRMPVR